MVSFKNYISLEEKETVEAMLFEFEDGNADVIRCSGQWKVY